MSSVKLCVCVLLVSSLYGADGFLEFAMQKCVFNSTELSDIEYIESYYYNKMELVRFTSTLGRFVGYTEIGVKIAAAWNNDPAVIAGRKAQVEGYCKHNVEIDYSAMLDKTAKPYVRLSSVSPPGGRHTAMLVCSVYDLFPKQIHVTWLRDGHAVTSDVTSSDEMADGDWYYQIHSYLEYTPRSGEKISCMVEHKSLPDPLVVTWDPSLPEGERNQIAIGSSGLVLGVVLSLAGFIYYKRKSRGRILVPNN